MEHKEILDLANAVADHLIVKMDERYAKKDMAEENHITLKGKNGDVGLVAKVDLINKSVSKLAYILTAIGISIIIEAAIIVYRF